MNFAPFLQTGRFGPIPKFLIVMKLIFVLLITALLQGSSAASYSQNVTLIVKQARLEIVLTEIGVQTGFDLIYNMKDINQAKPISVDLRNVPLEEALYECFQNQNLSYKVTNKTVIVTKKVQRTVLDLPTAPDPVTESVLQTRVSGRVTDASDNLPLPGVSVKVKGILVGTTTDLDGRYSIVVPDGSNILVFTYIGFTTQEIVVDNKTTIDVTLKTSSSVLNEVVVTALGIKREAKSLSYSTQSVSTKELTEARELNVVNSLQGKVAGLSINSSGTGVGAEARVVLRGNRSISGDSQPLYIIDGVPIRGNPSNLSLDNIASINILKGPNAAALYGSAAQNGAIVIETKNGVQGMDVSFNNTFMVMDPVLSIPFQNTYGQGQSGIYQKTAEVAWGPLLDGRTVSSWSLNPAQASNTYAFSPQPTNKIDAYNTGSSYASSLFASVGSEKTQSAFSYTFNNATGILPDNKLQRHNLSVRINNKFSKRMSMDSKIDYINQRINNKLAEGESNFNPNRQIYTMPSNINLADARQFEYVDGNGAIRQNFWNSTTTTGANPFWTLNRNPNVNLTERVIAMTSLTYNFTTALKFMVRGSYDGASGTMEEKLYNGTYVRAPDGRYSLNKSNDYLLNGDALLSYSGKFISDLTSSFSVGANIQRKRDKAVNSNTGTSMIIPNFFTLSNTNLPVTIDLPGQSSDIQSVYAFANFGWKDWLFADITGRNDWSSTLPTSSRSYFYPSVGLSAVLSDAISNMPSVISFAKIRASWASVGNSAPPYMLDRSAAFRAGGNFGFLQFNSILPNPDLLPEKTESTELGLDVRFFKARLGLDFTLYKTNTYNQLFTIALPVGSGAAQYFTNGGEVENRGFEALVTGIPVKTDKITWETNINFATNRNMVLEISDERPRIVVGSDPYVREFVIEQGQPYGQIYSKGFVRDANQRVVVGTNGLPKLTAGRTVQIANFNPDWTGGISNSINWGKLNLSFLIQHRQGGSMVSMTNAILTGSGLTEQTLEGRDGNLIFGQNVFKNETAVKEDGTPNNIAVKAETFWLGVGGRNSPVGEAFVGSATNTRFRELTLGYDVPAKLISRLPVSNMRISLVGRNLFYLYRESPDIDADLMQGTTPDSEGFQSFAPPTTRSIGLNLKIDFK